MQQLLGLVGRVLLEELDTEIPAEVVMRVRACYQVCYIKLPKDVRGADGVRRSAKVRSSQDRQAKQCTLAGCCLLL